MDRRAGLKPDHKEKTTNTLEQHKVVAYSIKYLIIIETSESCMFTGLLDK